MWFLFLFRFTGVAFLFLGIYLAPLFALRRIQNPGEPTLSVPVLLLILESVSTTVLGVYHTLSAGSGRNMPSSVFYLALHFQNLTCISFATSVLAGFYFALAARKLRHVFDRTKHHGEYLRIGFAISFAFVAAEVFQVYSVANYIHGVGFIFGLLFCLGNTAVASIYLYASLKFVQEGRLVFEKMGGSRHDYSNSMMKFSQMARLLRGSALCMLAATALTILYSLSGSLFYGVWGPEGYAFIYSSMVSFHPQVFHINFT